MSAETVLIVDAYADNIDFIQKHVLEPNGYRLLSAPNGVTALNMALSQPIDLLISDLALADMSGLELLESLKNAGKPLPVILTDRQKSPDNALNAFRLGAKDYLSKPFTIEDMTLAIERALTEARLRQERTQVVEMIQQTNQQLDVKTRELRVFQTIGHAISSSFDLDEILARIVEAAVSLSEAEEGAIMLLDAHGDLYLRASRGQDTPVEGEQKLKIQDSIAGQVVRTGEPIIIGGQDQYEAFKVKTRYFVKALVNIPIKAKNRVLGVLSVNNKLSSTPFNNYHLELLTTLADYVAIAVENVPDLPGTSLLPVAPAAAEASRLPAPADLPAALKHLATGIAHEFSAPVNNILAQTELMAQKDQTLTPHLAQINQEILKCRQIISHLLSYAAYEPPEKQTVDLNRVIDSALEKLKNSIIAAHIQVTRNNDPKPCRLSADPAQMEQAFLYILQNAIDNAPAQGKLKIVTRATGDKVQVIITASGQLPPLAAAGRTVDPFHTSARHQYGIDFSIAYGIIESHHGSIEIDTIAGDRTSYAIRLPA